VHRLDADRHVASASRCSTRAAVCRVCGREGMVVGLAEQLS
jgi:hypothetical protein